MWTIAPQAPLSTGFSRKEHWSELPFPSPMHESVRHHQACAQNKGLSRDSRLQGNGNPLQYSCLGNAMDRGAWWATVHGVAKSQTGAAASARQPGLPQFGAAGLESRNCGSARGLGATACFLRFFPGIWESPRAPPQRNGGLPPSRGRARCFVSQRSWM